jgi:hypothetical protein
MVVDQNDTSMMKSQHPGVSPDPAAAAPNNDSKPIQPAPLPLEWTRVQRKRARPIPAVQQGSQPMVECCDDPSCSLLASRHKEQAEASLLSDSTNQTFVGTVVFMLHEINPLWFQGYFFPRDSNKPWGLLAVQQEIDECLQCALGGYRVIQLTVFPYDGQVRLRKQLIADIEWTGGDMMRLKSPLVKMETDMFVANDKAIPTVERLFGSLLRKLRAESDNAELSTLDLFPDIAIVTGSIELTLAVTNDPGPL